VKKVVKNGHNRYVETDQTEERDFLVIDDVEFKCGKAATGPEVRFIKDDVIEIIIEKKKKTTSAKKDRIIRRVQADPGVRPAPEDHDDVDVFGQPGGEQPDPLGPGQYREEPPVLCPGRAPPAETSTSSASIRT